MSKKENDVDDLFKNAFDDFEPKVKPSVWKNIQVALKWGGVGLLFKFIINKLGTNTLVAALSSAVTVVSTVLVMNWTEKKEEVKPEEKTPAKTETTITVQTPDPIPMAEVPTTIAEPKKETTVAEVNTPKQNAQPVASVPLANPVVSEPEKTPVMDKEDKKKIKSVISAFSEQAIASISASPVGGSVPLIVNLSNIGTGTNNKWTFSDGKKESVGSNPVHVFEAPGVYSVVLTSTNADGKIATDSIKIEVTGNSSISSIPTLFSPNGDGVADFFSFQSKNMINMEVEIFDKRGVIFYKWLGNGGKWDGRNMKGEKAKEGTYFYIITAEGVDGKKYEQKGTINLAR